VGGLADYFALPATQEELVALLNECPNAIIIGNGSNLLFPDEGIRGLVISTLALRELTREGEYGLRAQAGALMPAIASFAQRIAFGGIEFVCGIPGTIGGGLVMNAGAYNGSLSDVIVESVYWDDGIHVETVHHFSYRHSVYTDAPQRKILSVLLQLKEGDPEAIASRIAWLTQKRKERQPIEWPSAGSAFKRPDGDFAARFIDECGLKGLRVGGAQVSEKHAGFIINTGNATCRDILGLIEKIQQEVQLQTGVLLEPEIHIIKEGRE
jgi:UDP-N-acetylmuramate dehydrogenase